MKLRDVAKGVWAVKAVPLRLANVGAPLPGQPPSEDPAVVKVGVRVLLGDETAQVYEKARNLASSKGVKEWSAEDPLCTLYEMACGLALAVCDVDQDTGVPVGVAGGQPEPFFDGGAEQVLSDIHIGTDNIAYLHEQWVAWQDHCSFRNRKYTLEEAVGLVILDMKASDVTDSPLLSMGHASLVSCLRIMGLQLFASQMDKSPSLPLAEDGTSSKSKSLLQNEQGLDASE